MHSAEPKDLFQAAQNGNTQQVLKILKAGADANASDRNGWTVLHHAAAYNKKSCLEAVLKHPGTNVNPQDNRGRTPLHRAAMWGNVATVEVLLESGADATVRNAWGAVPLQDALRQLTVEFNPAKDSLDALVHTLHPDRNQHVAIVKKLLPQTDDIEKMVCDEVRRSGIVPLAAFLAAGVDVANCRDDNESLVHIVVHKCDIPALELLLRYHPDLEARNRWNVTPLVVSVERNNPTIAAMLLKAGASVDCRDADGNTPLHMAAEAGYAEMAQLLISFNARIRAQNSKGAAPVHKAAGYGRLECLHVLLSHDSGCVHCTTKKRVTPLHWAARNGHIKCARLLIESGADVNACNQAGEKAIDVTSSPEMKELLRLASIDLARRPRALSMPSASPSRPPAASPSGAAPSPRANRSPWSTQEDNAVGMNDMLSSPSALSTPTFSMVTPLSPQSQVTQHPPLVMRSRTQSQHQPPLTTTFDDEPIVLRHRTQSQHQSGPAAPFAEVAGRARTQSVQTRVALSFVPPAEGNEDTASLLAQLRVGSEPQSPSPMHSPPSAAVVAPIGLSPHFLAPGAPAKPPVVDERLAGLTALSVDAVAYTPDAADVELAHSHLFVSASLGGKPVVVKKLSAGTDDVASNEIRVHAQLSHPNIARFNGYFVKDARYHVVLQGGARGQLSNHVGELGLASIIRIAHGVASALEYFYSESAVIQRAITEDSLQSFNLNQHGAMVVHHTVAPRTVLVDDAMNPLLTDFGLALQGVPPPPPVVSSTYDPLKYLAPEQVAFIENGSMTNEAVSVYQFAYLLFTLLTGIDIFPQQTGQQVIQGLLQENQLWQQSAQTGVTVNDAANTTFRPSMEGVRLPDNIFVQRLVTMMNHCWSHTPTLRPTFHQIRSMLEPFRALLDERPPLPVLWTAKQRLDFLSHVGAQLFASDGEGTDHSPRSTSASPRGATHQQQTNSAPPAPATAVSPRGQSPRQKSPRGTVASIAALALANVAAAQQAEDQTHEPHITIQQLSEKLDTGAGAITAGDWRVFFPPQLLARLEDRLITPPHMASSQQASMSVAALLRLIATFSRRLLPELEWQDVRIAINVHTLDDLARYIDACFPSLASHVYLIVRLFRPVDRKSVV